MKKLILTAFVAVAVRAQPSVIHDRNAALVDQENAAMSKLKSDFQIGAFKKHCPDLAYPSAMNCFANYLENRSDSKKLSIVEVPELTEIAGLVALKTEGQNPVEKLQAGTNFLSLLSGLYALSRDYRSLVPPEKVAKTKKQKSDVQQLRQIESEMAQRLKAHLGEKLSSLTKESLLELQKLPDAPEKQALQMRLQEIQKTAPL